MNNIKNLPREERPYEKCLSYGVEALTDVELLSVILRTGTKGCNVKELATKMLQNEKGNINVLSLTHLSFEQLIKIRRGGFRLSNNRNTPRKSEDTPIWQTMH